MSALVGISSYVSYGGEDKTLRCALAVIMLSVTISPAVLLLGEIFSNDYCEAVPEPDGITIGDTDFSASAEDAYCRGIEMLVASEFSFDNEDVIVKAYGFDSINMKCEKIEVCLYGKAALADHRSIIQILNESGFDKCEVKLYAD